MKGAVGKWKKGSGFDERMDEAKKLSGGARKDALNQLNAELTDWQDKYLQEKMTPEEYHAHKNYISAFGYHFSGSAKFFVRVGEVMAKAFYTKKNQ